MEEHKLYWYGRPLDEKVQETIVVELDEPFPYETIKLKEEELNEKIEC